MKKEIIITLIMLFISTYSILSSPQIPDYLIYKGKKGFILPNLLERYFDTIQCRPNDILKICSTGCVRGYIATWIIEDNKIYLKEIKSTCTNINLKSIFPNAKNNKVFAWWINQEVFSPNGECILYHPSGYGLYEYEVGYEIKNGIIIKINEYDNTKSIKSEYTENPDLVSEFIFKNINKDILIDTLNIKNCQFVSNIFSNYFGKIDSVHVLQGVSEKIDIELIRIIKLLPSWSFYYEHGKPIGNNYQFEIALCAKSEYDFDLIQQNAKKYYKYDENDDNVKSTKNIRLKDCNCISSESEPFIIKAVIILTIILLTILFVRYLNKRKRD